MRVKLTGFVNNGKLVLNIRKKNRKYFPHLLELELCTSKIKPRILEQ